jgi:hypothetical protein
MVREGGDHRVHMLGTCEKEHRRRFLGNLCTDVVDERVVQPRDVFGFTEAARHASGDEPDRGPAGPKKIPATAPVGGRPFLTHSRS